MWNLPCPDRPGEPDGNREVSMLPDKDNLGAVNNAFAVPSSFPNLVSDFERTCIPLGQKKYFFSFFCWHLVQVYDIIVVHMYNTLVKGD
jgi:hypothetical protein